MKTNKVEFNIEYCELCESWFIRCPRCLNNSCSSGYGEIYGKKCDLCPIAYDLQDWLGKDNNIERFYDELVAKEEAKRKALERRQKLFRRNSLGETIIDLGTGEVAPPGEKNNGRKRLSWEKTALKLAYNIAEYRSQDPYVTVGATIIKNDNSIILGYNGCPPGIEIDWSNRDERRKRIIHAEENVLAEVKYGEVKIMAVTALPCEICIKSAAKKGVKVIYYGEELVGYNHELTFQLAKEFGIELIKL